MWIQVLDVDERRGRLSHQENPRFLIQESYPNSARITEKKGGKLE
jgi:hypothetical protein